MPTWFLLLLHSHSEPHIRASSGRSEPGPGWMCLDKQNRTRSHQRGVQPLSLAAEASASCFNSALLFALVSSIFASATSGTFCFFSCCSECKQQQQQQRRRQPQRQNLAISSLISCSCQTRVKHTGSLCTISRIFPDNNFLFTQIKPRLLRFSSPCPISRFAHRRSAHSKPDQNPEQSLVARLKNHVGRARLARVNGRSGAERKPLILELNGAI